jgi:hypothetical protein
MNEILLNLRHQARRWVVLLTGLALVLVGHYYKPYYGTESLPTIVFTEILIDVGIGFFVAAVVSVMFDVWYHRTLFGEPIEEIDNKVKGLNSTVSNMTLTINNITTAVDNMTETVVGFTPVLKSAQANGISAIYRRNTDQEIIEWKDRVRTTVKNANKYVFIMGRTLDEILPVRHKENGIYGVLSEKAQVPVIFLLADTFDQKGDFRLETMDRAGVNARSLYDRTRDTVKQILDLANGIEDPLISVGLLKKGPPFALFMTERSAIIEPYLPYLEGGRSIIYEVHSNDAAPLASSLISASLHHAHKSCFGKLYNESRLISEVIDEYVKEKEHKGESDEVENYRPYQIISNKLKSTEREVITRAELF